jgi:hypothetical protein
MRILSRGSIVRYRLELFDGRKIVVYSIRMGREFMTALWRDEPTMGADLWQVRERGEYLVRVFCGQSESKV